MWYLQVTWDLILTLVHFDSDSPSTGLDRGCDLDSCLCSSQVTFILDLNLSQVTWDPITGTELLHLVSCRVVLQLSSCPASLKSCSLIGCSPASLPRPCWAGTGSGVRWVSRRTDDPSEEEIKYWTFVFVSQVLSSCRDSERSSSWSAVFIDPLCFYWFHLQMLTGLKVCEEHFSSYLFIIFQNIKAEQS